MIFSSKSSITLLLCLPILPAEIACSSRTGNDSGTQDTHTGTESWVEYTDEAEGLSFKYPDSLATTYISPANWPPQIEASTQPFECEVGSQEIADQGQTEERIINGRPYCVTQATEGAAGSIYTTYTYVFEQGGEVVNVRFSLRYSQCYNYDEPEQGECQTERESFDVDALVDQMAGTLSVNE